MRSVTNEELIRSAASFVRARKQGDATVGGVGCALVSENNNLYLGMCIDTSSGMGFCAEHNAIGSMVTAGESRIRKIVAVWIGKGKKRGVYILSPCGRCREFMYRINKANLSTEVVLANAVIPYNAF